MVAAKQRYYPPDIQVVRERVKLCRSCNGAGWVLDFEFPVNPAKMDDHIALALIPCPDGSCTVSGTPVLTLDVHRAALSRVSKVAGVVASVLPGQISDEHSAATAGGIVAADDDSHAARLARAAYSLGLSSGLREPC